MYCIYLHRNKINNKIYIGMTNDTKARWRSNGKAYSRHNKQFYDDIQKYSWDNFEHIILEDNLDETTARKAEREYIDDYIEKGYELYNQEPGGSGGHVYKVHPKGFKGHKHTDEYINHMREFSSQKENNCMTNGKVIWDETHPHPRGFKGHKRTEEEKRKISATLKSKVHPGNCPCNVIYPDGNVEFFVSLSQAAEKLGVSNRIIKRMIDNPYEIKKSTNNKSYYEKFVGIKIELVDK